MDDVLCGLGVFVATFGVYVASCQFCARFPFLVPKDLAIVPCAFFAARSSLLRWEGIDSPQTDWFLVAFWVFVETIDALAMYGFNRTISPFMTVLAWSAFDTSTAFSMALMLAFSSTFRAACRLCRFEQYEFLFEGVEIFVLITYVFYKIMRDAFRPTDLLQLISVCFMYGSTRSTPFAHTILFRGHDTRRVYPPADVFQKTIQFCTDKSFLLLSDAPEDYSKKDPEPPPQEDEPREQSPEQEQPRDDKPSDDKPSDDKPREQEPREQELRDDKPSDDEPREETQEQTRNDKPKDRIKKKSTSAPPVPLRDLDVVVWFLSRSREDVVYFVEGAQRLSTVPEAAEFLRRHIFPDYVGIERDSRSSRDSLRRTANSIRNEPSRYGPFPNPCDREISYETLYDTVHRVLKQCPTNY